MIELPRDTFMHVDYVDETGKTYTKKYTMKSVEQMVEMVKFCEQRGLKHSVTERDFAHLVRRTLDE